MQVTETATEGLVQTFSVVIPAAEVDHSVQERLVELAKEVKMDGFRRAKVPMQLLQRRFGSSARMDVVGNKLEEAVRSIIDEHDLRLALKPDVTINNDTPGADLTATVSCESLPSFSLEPLKQAKIETLNVTFSEDELAKLKHTFLLSRADWQAIEKFDTEGDVRVRLRLRDAGDDAEWSEEQAILLSNPHPSWETAWPGIIQQLRAAKPSDEFDCERSSSSEGQEPAVSRFKVEAYERATLPEVDAALLSSVKIDDDAIAHAGDAALESLLLAKLRESVDAEVLKTNFDLQKEAFYRQLPELLDLQLPPTLLAHEKKRLATLLERDVDDQEVTEEASNNLLKQLALRQYIEEHDIQVSESEKMERLSDFIEKDWQLAVKLAQGDKEAVALYENLCFEQKALQRIFDDVEKVEKTISYTAYRDLS